MLDGIQKTCGKYCTSGGTVSIIFKYSTPAARVSSARTAPAALAGRLDHRPWGGFLRSPVSTRLAFFLQNPIQDLHPRVRKWFYPLSVTRSAFFLLLLYTPRVLKRLSLYSSCFSDLLLFIQKRIRCLAPRVLKLKRSPSLSLFVVLRPTFSFFLSSI